ncbi:tRNA epoxyqueuosine(34) reductase QueG [Jeotgalibaca sp. MA1X17-3]|uniref:tRNA epoxyqueuosine(34) reductase QueG n=1 Tax=Jeotgalibaca sp. MA1X17-3 TaxID=2908211 RepID=UPI001F2A19CA|nr:tRNA epoxyqueuosine(34) reductase QueG [Jeotgalibaca sp. MA1X17-3]UJF15202.1 tRNA epoxyqueuosine(34) reductase QueG [Jeotgalibaca sp. MA1X17-3]
MDIADLKRQVIEACKEIGIDKIGFTTAEPFEYMEKPLQEQHAKGHTTGFEHRVLKERIYPDLIFDQPKSILSICLAYPSKPLEKAERVKGERRGSFARASWGVDYHDILRDKMDQLVSFMQEKVPSARFKPMVDTGELIDTVVAQRAGVGFIGRHGLLITEEFGSYVYLGEIVTDIYFEPDEPGEFGCGECTRCVTSCPTGAILGNGELNPILCLSFQTQTKGSMPEEFRSKIGHVIYGCDICQQACPYNRGKNFHLHPEMEPEPDRETPLLQPFLTISNREFKERYGVLAGSWRGKKPLQRNAIIALANYRDRTAIPELLKVMEKDPRPMIRGTAGWAIGEIMRQINPELLGFFRERIDVEEDLEAKAEMEMALEKLEQL